MCFVESSIDFVMFVADKFGIKSLYEKCESFVAEKVIIIRRDGLVKMEILLIPKTNWKKQ